MSNRLTIHFHLKHYKDSGLSLLEYFLCLLYENKPDWSLEEIQSVLKVCERTVIRTRNSLTAKGYFECNKRGDYSLTDKLYK